MATVYRQDGTSYSVIDDVNLIVTKKLPAQNFIIGYNPMTDSLYLEGVDSFELPTKLYGDTTKRAERILNTFNDRGSSTGVLLTGEKGSGKTLLAKTLSVQAAKLGYPTIIINSDWKGDKFNKLIQDIEQPCVVFFDEFEKIYDSDGQESLLTLLDGVFPTKKLFVLTCNDAYRIDRHMVNRPGRLYYSIDFRGLTPEFIKEYCELNLKNISWVEQVGQVATLFDQFNFDMLKALVEEMNRYDESPRDALDMLNIKPRGESEGTWDVKLTIGGKEVILKNTIWHGNPLAQKGTIDVWLSDSNTLEMKRMFDALDPSEGERDEDDSRWCEFEQTDLKHIDSVAGTLVYSQGEVKVVFTRRRFADYDYRSALF